MGTNKKAAKEFLEELMAQTISSDGDNFFLDSLDIPEDKREGMTYDQIFWTRLVHKAIGGDMKAIQEVLDRRYGKAPQHILNENHNMTYVKFLDAIEEAEVVGPQVKEIEPSDVVRGSSKDQSLKDLGLI